MHYHVIIDGKEKIGKNKDKNKQYFELDETDLSKIEEEIVKPYLGNEEFLFMGSFLNKSSIERIQIRETVKEAQEIADSVNDEYRNKMRQARVFSPIYYSPAQVVQIEKYSKDITDIVLKNVKHIKNNRAETAKSNCHLKIFIVHGRDDEAKTKTARFIEKLGFTAIILHKQSNSGKTIIEKIEEHTYDVGFAIILYTPCDLGGLADSSPQKARARQNVVFEHGYLMAKLGRENVCTLVKGDVEPPNDISGIVYTPFDAHNAWHTVIAKELKAAGYKFDPSRLID